MKRAKIVFAGTPDFAVPPLRVLIDSPHEVVGVYSQPDRPAGRGRKLTASPVKQLAVDAGIPVFQPQTLKTAEAQAELRALAPDLMVVVAYGLLLPVVVLTTPTLGCVNLHASLLPRWRGAAPIQRAILAGDTESGVCLMQMDEGLDTGKVLSKVALPITGDEIGATLHDKLAAAGATLLHDSLGALLAGELTAQPQPTEGVTYAHKLQKSEALLDWQQDAVALERQVRAFNAWPVAQTHLEGKTLRIWRAKAVAQATDAAPGTVIGESGDAILVACGSGQLALQEIQLPGKRALPVRDFLNANSMLGQQLGQ